MGKATAMKGLRVNNQVEIKLPALSENFGSSVLNTLPKASLLRKACNRSTVLVSNVEQELHHIALSDDIIFALTAQPTLVAGLSQ